LQEGGIIALNLNPRKPTSKQSSLNLIAEDIRLEN
jgi:hypothetical protein